jgi:hypothetical protein
MEIAVTAAIILAEIQVFRWVIHRMPVLNDSPAWARDAARVEHIPATEPELQTMEA